MNEDKSVDALPAAAVAFIRQLVLMAGPTLVATGKVDAGSIEGIATIVVTAASLGWGLYKTYQRQRRINKAEQTLGTLK